MTDETYEISCEFITETDNAVLIKDPETDNEHWIPFSQMICRNVQANKFGTIEITRWIAVKKGLIK